MEVGNYIVCGRDDGKTTTLCPRQVRQVRRLAPWAVLLFRAVLLFVREGPFSQKKKSKHTSEAGGALTENCNQRDCVMRVVDVESGVCVQGVCVAHDCVHANPGCNSLRLR